MQIEEPGNRRDISFQFTLMARLARVVAANLPHHATQRGNARQSILTADGERRVSLDLLQHYVSLHELSLLGYCLMSNHVHLVAIPRKGDGLAVTFFERLLPCTFKQKRRGTSRLSPSFPEKHTMQ